MQALLKSQYLNFDIHINFPEGSMWEQGVLKRFRSFYSSK
jgi:hypothetical protein